MTHARYVRCRRCGAIAAGSAGNCPSCDVRLAAPPRPTPSESRPSRIETWLPAIAFVGLALFLGLFFLPILALLGFAQLLSGRWKHLLGTIALVVFVLASPALQGALDYSDGTASLMAFGLFTHEGGSNNLDRTYRCPRTSLGCMPDPVMGTHAAIYNGAVRWMIESFGPMEGAYTGTYPTRSEAFRILQDHGRQVTSESIRREGILEVLPEIDRRSDRSTARVARIDGCLLIGIQSGYDPEVLESITLVDAETKTWFACYHRWFDDR